MVGTALTRYFVIQGAFTPWTHAGMVLVAIGLSAALTSIILRLAFQPLRALRQAIDRSNRPVLAAPARLSRFGDPDIIAVAQAVRGLWDRLDQHVQLLEESNRRLEAQRAELAEKTVQLEQLATQALAAQEEERRRLARELHDDTMQSMAALIMGLERGLHAMPEDLPHLRQAHRTVARLRDLAVRILDDLRYLALDLRPAVLDDHGLAAALRWLADTHQERTGLSVALECDPAVEARRLPPVVETTLYRIAQEALSNVTRHAHAEHVSIRLACHAGLHPVTLLEVSDDGIGLPAAPAPPPGHMGIFNMRERTALLGGTFEIGPGPARRGTVVRARVPITGSSRAEPTEPAESAEPEVSHVEHSAT